MRQQTFADEALKNYHKTTFRAEILKQMAQINPQTQLAAVIGSSYPKPERVGRRLIDIHEICAPTVSSAESTRLIREQRKASTASGPCAASLVAGPRLSAAKWNEDQPRHDCARHPNPCARVYLRRPAHSAHKDLTAKGGGDA